MNRITGKAFDDHGELARWLENEPTIMVCGEERTCRDLLMWDAGRLFSALALGKLARAVVPIRPESVKPAPCCPTCGAIGGRLIWKDTYTHNGCTTWREDRRAPCPECAVNKARIEAALEILDTIWCADGNSDSDRRLRPVVEALKGGE